MRQNLKKLVQVFAVFCCVLAGYRSGVYTHNDRRGLERKPDQGMSEQA